MLVWNIRVISRRICRICIIAVSLQAVSGFLTCAPNLPENPYLSITIEPIADIRIGDSCRVKGILQSNQSIDSITYSILDSLSNPVSPDTIGLSFTINKRTDAIDLMNDAALTIAPKNGAYLGGYWLFIQATMGPVKGTRMKQFFVVGN